MLARLEREFRDLGKGELFNRLKSSLLAEECGSTYAEVGAGLNLTESAVKQAVHRMHVVRYSPSTDRCNPKCRKRKGQIYAKFLISLNLLVGFRHGA